VASRFQRVDESNIADHPRLRASDHCLYLREYTSRKGFAFSETNNLISNLKKKKGDGGYHYKAPAIDQCAGEIAAALNPEWLKVATVVPIPPSKLRTDPAYDDRLLQVCQRIAARMNSPLDVRELVRQTETIRAAHENPDRPTVEELLKIYEIDEARCKESVKQIGIIDDVLTAGTHYRAMHTVLSQRFPETTIVGLFVARRVFAADAKEEFVLFSI
jgi:predicted amidophosphoribosyltransferase